MSTLEQQVERELIRKEKLKVKLEKRIEDTRARMHKMGKKMRADDVLLEQLTAGNYKAAVKIEREGEKG